MWTMQLFLIVTSLMITRTHPQEYEAGPVSCVVNGAPGVCKRRDRCDLFKHAPPEDWALVPCSVDGDELTICCVDSALNSISGSSEGPVSSNGVWKSRIEGSTTRSVFSTTGAPVATTSQTGSTTTEYIPDVYDYQTLEPIPDDCRKLGPEETVPRIGRRAYDKCIEYQEQLVYPCEKSVALLSNKVRYNRCNHQLSSTASVGSTRVLHQEFPHMVVFVRGSGLSEQWLCAGALISERFVLTAAHCKFYRRKRDMETFALIGDVRVWPTDSGQQRHRVGRVIRHPQYRRDSRYHNIALVKTATDIKLSQFAVPACLDVFGGDVSRAVATGWTAADRMKREFQSLKRVTLQQYSWRKCSQRYADHRNLQHGFTPATLYCFGENFTYPDACQDDSGGPLTIPNPLVRCMYSVIAISSLHKACAGHRDSGLYARLDSYVTWIEDVVWPEKKNNTI